MHTPPRSSSLLYSQAGIMRLCTLVLVVMAAACIVFCTIKQSKWSSQDNENCSQNDLRVTSMQLAELECRARCIHSNYHPWNGIALENCVSSQIKKEVKLVKKFNIVRNWFAHNKSALKNHCCSKIAFHFPIILAIFPSWAFLSSDRAPTYERS